MIDCEVFVLTLLHSEWPKLYGVLAILSGIGLNEAEIYLYLMLVLPVTDKSYGSDNSIIVVSMNFSLVCFMSVL